MQHPSTVPSRSPHRNDLALASLSTNMKLEGLAGDRLVCTDGLAVLEEDDGGGLALASQLPTPSPVAGLRRWVDAAALPRAVLSRLVGDYPVANVWPLPSGDRVATVGRWVLSRHGDGPWVRRHRLPASSSTRGVLPGAVCHHEGTVYLGEYPLAKDAVPRVLASRDGGRTWRPHLTLPGVRHVHSLQVDPFGGDVWVTTGDADAACRVGRLRDGTLEVIGGGSQRWRAVELAFTPTAVLWGMDWVNAEENELLRLDRADVDDPDPAPAVVGAVDASVYHAATLAVDDDYWVALATAGEIGDDRTDRRGGQRHSRGPARVIAASSATGFERWHELARFERRRCLADAPGVAGRLPRANAYVFLASHPDRGLFVNPYNAVPGDGTVRLVPPDRFRALAAADRRREPPVSVGEG